MLFWSAKVVAIFNVFPSFFILNSVHLSKWSFLENSQNSKKISQIVHISFLCVIFTLMGLLSWNLITSCLGAPFLQTVYIGKVPKLSLKEHPQLRISKMIVGRLETNICYKKYSNFLPEILFFWSLNMRASGQTLLKTFEMSKNTPQNSKAIIKWVI